MRVGLFTSVPLVPPWDQGDKNLAYALAGALPHICFSAFTTREGPMPAGCNLHLQPVYRTRRPSLLEKAGIYGWMLASGAGPRPDLYHLIYQPTRLSSYALRWLPAIHGSPVIHTVPATTESHPLHPNLFFADRVVAISETGRRALLSAGLQSVDYIPHGIPVAPWAALAGRAGDYKGRLDLSGRPVVLYPGHLGPNYGIDTLLEALVNVRRAIPGVVVLLACRPRSGRDVERRTAVRARIAAAGLEDAVRWYETVPDMRLLVGASDLLVLPFRTMRDKIDIPTTLLEGLAAGKPAILSDVGPMNEVISLHGAALHPESVGSLIPPADPVALAGALVRLLADSAARQAMGQRGARLAHERFDIQLVARRYEQIYREVSP